MRFAAAILIALTLLAPPGAAFAHSSPWQEADQETLQDQADDVTVKTDTPASETENADAMQAKPDEEEKLVCKSLAVTGTRFKRRFCRTEAEWERIRNGMADVADEMRRDGAQRVVEDGNNPGTGIPTGDPQ